MSKNQFVNPFVLQYNMTTNMAQVSLLVSPPCNQINVEPLIGGTYFTSGNIKYSSSGSDGEFWYHAINKHIWKPKLESSKIFKTFKAVSFTVWNYFSSVQKLIYDAFLYHINLCSVNK